MKFEGNVRIAQQFDTLAYLSANADVAKALNEGRIISAWSHFVQWGYRENRKGVSKHWEQLVQRVMGLSHKAPPDYLIARVHGTSDSASFELIGKRIALDLLQIAGARFDFGGAFEILDFGCGCGRVLSSMSEIARRSHFHATDIDEEAITWCKDRYANAVTAGRFKFTTNKDHPPLAIDSNTFDLVYAVSVFTHLPEDMQFEWIAELLRVTKNGGTVLISIAGDNLIRNHLNLEDRRTLDEKGFYYHPYGSTEGLPEYYQAAWHTRDYVERVWSPYFKIAEFLPLYIADHQDLVVCLKQ